MLGVRLASVGTIKCAVSNLSAIRCINGCYSNFDPFPNDLSEQLHSFIRHSNNLYAFSKLLMLSLLNYANGVMRRCVAIWTRSPCLLNAIGITLHKHGCGKWFIRCTTMRVSNVTTSAHGWHNRESSCGSAVMSTYTGMQFDLLASVKFSIIPFINLITRSTYTLFVLDSTCKLTRRLVLSSHNVSNRGREVDNVCVPMRSALPKWVAALTAKIRIFYTIYALPFCTATRSLALTAWRLTYALYMWIWYNLS